jgi:hypothetical protein
MAARWFIVPGDEQAHAQAGRVEMTAAGITGNFSPPAQSARRAFCCDDERSEMANHLTPEELSQEVGIEREEVIRICIEENVPIYQGKIDKTLFQAHLTVINGLPPKH